MKTLALFAALFCAQPLFADWISTPDTANGTGTAGALTLSPACTAGNYVVGFFDNGGGTTFSAATIEGNNFTQDFATATNSLVWYSYGPCAGGEDTIATTQGVSGAWRLTAVEIPPLDTTPEDGNVAWAAASGEGTATDHSLEITNAGTPRAAVAFAYTDDNRTISDASGTQTFTINSSFTGSRFLLYNDGLASGAVALNGTLNSSAAIIYTAISYETPAGGGGSKVPLFTQQHSE